MDLATCRLCVAVLSAVPRSRTGDTETLPFFWRPVSETCLKTATWQNGTPSGSKRMPSPLLFERLCHFGSAFRLQPGSLLLNFADEAHKGPEPPTYTAQGEERRQIKALQQPAQSGDIMSLVPVGLRRSAVACRHTSHAHRRLRSEAPTWKFDPRPPGASSAPSKTKERERERVVTLCCSTAFCL